MTSILLVIIYFGFISLGLPDSMLGSAWPSMYQGMDVPVSYAGIVSMIIAAGTVTSSMLSDKLIRKLGTGVVTLISVAMTAVALFGFSFSSTFIGLCLWGVPYGLGGGSIDAALNNYVAKHYKSRHMSWLHCFWGVGATAGPYIMGWCLTNGFTWNSGYRTVGSIQIVLVLFMLFSLPLWKLSQTTESGVEEQMTSMTFRQTIGLRGAKPTMAAFFCYCALEATTGLWASSYLVLHKEMDTQLAAKWASLFFLGITAGRFICGFITERLGDRRMIRIGQGLIAIGILLLLLPAANVMALAGLIMIGLGCAPIYPSLLHATPDNFGADKSQSIMGMQMACAYIGSTFMPSVFGFLAGAVSIRLYPVYLLFFVIVMFIMGERMNRLHAKV